MNPAIRNVLLFSIEDLNDWIEPLGGHPAARTPNLTRLAERGVVFTGAQAPAPACAPSRAATMFGQSPWRTGLYNNAQSWEQVYDGSGASLPGIAKSAGWTTYCAGKIFFRPVADGLSWTDQAPKPGKEKGSSPPVSRAAKAGALGAVDDFGPLDGHSVAIDRSGCEWLGERIRADADHTIWALGLTATHLPFFSPPAYFADLPARPGPPPSLRSDRFRADDRDELQGLASGGRLYAEAQGARGRMLDRFDEYDDFVRAYLACIGYADDLLGRTLDRLDDCGLRDTTLIVLWSDHGWQFGEKLAFSKFTLWERALRVPFMVAGPGISPRRLDTPVSLLDLYPTVSGLVGLAPPHRLDGQDLSGVLAGGEPPRDAAISAYLALEGEDHPSLSVRTPHHRLTRYGDGSMELYDHRSDPHEHTNLLAGDPADPNAVRIALELSALLPATAAAPVDVDPARAAKMRKRRGKRMERMETTDLR